MVVPGDFRDDEVFWVLTFRGDTQTIPGHLHRDWLLDALGGNTRGDTPPAVRFAEDGREFRGPGGAPEGPLTATAGEAMPLAVWATDDGVARRPGEANDEPQPLVRLSLHPHQGPGDLRRPRDRDRRGRSRAGRDHPDLQRARRVRPAGLRQRPLRGGGSQCCWTNAFVRVTVC